MQDISLLRQYRHCTEAMQKVTRLDGPTDWASVLLERWNIASRDGQTPAASLQALHRSQRALSAARTGRRLPQRPDWAGGGLLAYGADGCIYVGFGFLFFGSWDARYCQQLTPFIKNFLGGQISS
ncbi:hypothetical protein SODALDRAFT_354066 [Sodiomyces alkalinus F11]|uniref:Uncharacterized protein n=1 Tax=Sodiomyces alkalinus (strain CBS 110278 / VKM F-3762 / F11) TaxID=1314773 RepID=A0A3N2Q597_SODAK|nr:hypothetical protein SODALDRAFT_354066 [Sodiomyces alkalinus F11]ROT41943.1 hypothetical protein SODALDRAFT_354066 [Sodiomyces alkalinus F11]